MAVGGANPRVEADVAAMLREPLGAGEHVRLVLRLGGDAGKAQERAQLSHKPGLVAFQIIEHDLHDDQLTCETRVCQAEPSGNSLKWPGAVSSLAGAGELILEQPKQNPPLPTLCRAGKRPEAGVKAGRNDGWKSIPSPAGSQPPTASGRGRHR